MKKLAVSLVILISTITGWSFPIFEPFEDASGSGGTTYPNNTTLIGKKTALGDTWVGIGTTTTGPNVTCTNINLTLSGLPGTAGVGGIFLTNTTGGPSGRIVTSGNLQGAQGSGVNGKMYWSATIKVLALGGLTAAPTFCAGFNNATTSGQTAMPSVFCARLWFVKTNTTQYAICFSKKSETQVMESTAHNVGDTVFVVGQYEMVNGTSGASSTDDNARMWINPSSSTFGADENSLPAPTLQSLANGADIDTPGVASFLVANRSSTMPQFVMDNLRVGTNWAWVTGAPFITTQPAASSSIAYTGSASFTVAGTASGGTLTYQWQRNGVNVANGASGTATISGATSATLNIVNAGSANAGTYTCILNGGGAASSTSSSSVLTVGDPTISTQPVASQNLPPGSQAVMSVVATGTPTLTYQWKKGGVNLSNGLQGSGSTVTGATTANLTIDTIAAPGDSGSYTCAITNGAGATVTTSASVLTVVDPAVTTQPTSQTHSYNDTVTFHIAAAGTAPFSYQWQKGATPLSNGGIISGATTDTLTLTGVSHLDADSYSCVVTNDQGDSLPHSATSSAATLVVNDPAITSQPTGQTVAVGNPVTLSVAASGTATVSYQWKRNGNPLTDGSGATGTTNGSTTSTLSLTSTTTSMSGTYTCVVSGSASGQNNTSSSAVVVVAIPPNFTTNPKSRVQHPGEHLTFDTAANATATLTYQWKLNGNPVSGGTSSILTLTNITVADAGTYTVEVNESTSLTGISVTNSCTLTVTSAQSAYHLGSGNLILTRTGDGAQPLRLAAANQGNTFYVDQYTTAGVPVSTLQMPDKGAFPIVVQGAEGTGGAAGLGEACLSASPNGRFLGVAGYNVSVDTVAAATLASSTLSAVPRIAYVVNGFGYLQQTWTNNGSVGAIGSSSMRSVCPDSTGTNFWYTTGGTGLRYENYLTDNLLYNTTINYRYIATFGGDIYMSGAGSGTGGSGQSAGWLIKFSGLPSSGTQTPTVIFNAGASVPYNEFSVSPDGQSVYIANGNIGASGGNGAERWDNVGGTWTKAYQISASGFGARGLSVDWSAHASWGPGVVGAIVYATTAELSNNHLVSCVDNGVGVQTVNVLAAAGPNQVFRSVKFPPTPVTASIASGVTPASRNATTGGSVTFSVVAGGDAPFTYAWRKGGTPISNGASGNGSTYSGADTASLTISGLAAADAGSYSVVVNNDLGSATSTDGVLGEVLDAVSITTPPTSQTVNYGDTVNFSSAATGGGTLAYKWQKNGVNLTDGLTGTGSTISGSATATLQIQNANYGDGRPTNYTVVVSNAASTNSATASLFVNDPYIVTNPVPTTVNAGSSATFHGTIAGSPGSGYQWRKNGNPISDGAKYQGTTTDTLTILNTDNNDEGNYQIKTVGCCGQSGLPASANAVLTVVDPYITSSPTSLTKATGHTAVFNVSASGAALTYQWQKDNSNIDTLANPSAATSSLTLSGLVTGDSGAYSCNVTGGDGTVSSGSANLTVINAVTITSPLVNQTNAAGTTAIFTVGASGGGTLSYSWTKGGNALSNGGNISGATTASLTVANVQSSDVSTYAVTVANSDSSASSSAILVLDPAITTQPQSATSECGSSPCLSVTATSATDLGYQWFTGDLNSSTVITDATNASYCFSNIHAPSAGSYFVVVTNTMGNSITSSVVTVTIVDTTAPVVTINGNASVTVECHDSYSEAGASANDGCDGSVGVTIGGTVNANAVGNYTLTYSATDAANNTGTATRIVHVVDTTAPVITVLDSNPATVECHGSYTDAGATVADVCDAGATVSSIGGVDVNTPGSYTITYSSTDASSNTGTATRVVNVTDTLAPVITLTGAASMTVECHQSFTDPGATANDACEGPGITVTSSGSVNANVVGVYTLTYTACDSGSRCSTATRVVHVNDSAPPSVTITGANPMPVECHGSFTDPGATASDDCDALANVVTTGSVNPNAVGSYTLTYTATDADGNTATDTRVVNVVDTTAPSITATGGDQTVECHDAYTDPGATASDACSGNLTGNIVVSGATVDANTPGVYVVTYTVADAANNSNSTTRTVTVQDTTVPDISLNGPASTNICQFSSYTDPGATANDGCGGAIVPTMSGSVDTSVAGNYTLTFTATDAANNSVTTNRVVVVGPCGVTIIDPPHDVTVDANSPFTLSVNATAAESLTYQWKKGATVLAGETNASYTVAHAFRTNAGTYSVDVTGSSTTNVGPAVVSVNDPAIVSSPASRTINVPATNRTVFTVVASGTAVLRYQWLLNGTKITGATTPNYTLTNIVAGMTGRSYSCVVSNAGGHTATSATAVLTVRQAPTSVAITPATQSVYVGSNAYFKVTVTPPSANLPQYGGPVVYQWVKGTKAAFTVLNDGVSGNGSTLSGTQTASFAIQNVQLGDTGSYCCIVTNATATNVFSAVSRLVAKDYTTAPTVVITKAIQNAKYLTNPVTMNGTATDLGLISDVWLTQTTFGAATITNEDMTFVYRSNSLHQPIPGSVLWTNVVNLAPGTNVFVAYAQNGKGTNGFSKPPRLVFLLERSSLNLIPTPSGHGTIVSSNLTAVGLGNPVTGTNVYVNIGYTVTARPAIGKHFLGWFDGSDNPYPSSPANTNKILRFTIPDTNGVTLKATFD